MDIKELAEKIHATNVEKGFWLEPRPVPVRLMLIVSECAEAMEGDRKGIDTYDEGGLAEELADIVIRTLDFAEGYGINIQTAIEKKMVFNKTRPHMHGGKKY